MSILQNRAFPKMFGALTALALGASLAATGSASAQKFFNPAVSPNGAEVLTGYPQTATPISPIDRCAAVTGAEILGSFQSEEKVACRR